MIYYIADNHFGHGKVIQYCDRNFKDVIEMNDYMLECWNSTVRKDDDVYIIGDLAFRKDTLEEYIMKLNGKKHLIIGNHDNVFLKRASDDILNKCFVEITQYKEIDDNGRLVVLFHYPIMDWNKKHYGSYHIHGHIHNRENEVQEYSRNTNNMFNVGVDVIGYKPLALDELIHIKLIESIGRSYKKEMNTLSLLELISLISKVSAEAFCRQFIVFNDADIKQCTKNYIKEFIESIPKGFDVRSIESNFSKNNKEVNLEELNIDIPDGYSIYIANKNSGEYNIRTGLTEKEAYSYYDKQINNMLVTEIMLIHANDILEHNIK